jgi:signal transduction histidine kinase
MFDAWLGGHFKSVGPKNGTSRSAAPLTAWHHTRPAPSALRREVAHLSARVAQLEAEKAGLERFAAIAAHEMLEPLVMTEAYAAIVGERLDAEDEESRVAVETIGRSAARARVLIETLLHDARAADRNPIVEDVDLAEEARHCIAQLAPELEAREARVVVGELPRVRGEAALLGSVLSNLLVNAMKYSSRRDAVIEIGAERERDCWKIFVKSSGPTIAVDQRERIFEQFSRARNERRARGTGLGLAICRKIVEGHGGSIGVTAANGSGNCFYFTLPAT